MASGSGPGTWVHGMLNPRRNRSFRSDPPIDFSFTLDGDGGGVFELINYRDGEGRLFGAIRTKALVGATNTSYDLRTSLRRISTGATVSSLDFIVEVKDTPLIEVMRTRALEWAFTKNRLWGRNEPSESALETQVSYIENNGGELRNNDLYAWSKYQKRTKGSLDNKWIKGLEDLGGLGWAYMDRPTPSKWEKSAEQGRNGMNPLDSSFKTRVGAAIKTALVALAEAVPIDATDVFDSSDLSSLSHNGKDYHGEGFAGVPTMNTIPNQDVKHQWRYTEALGLTVMGIGQDLHVAALNGDASATAAMDAIVRLGTPNFALNENHRVIDKPKALGSRWGDLLSNRAQGVWMDANLGHRLRAWTAFAIATNDYNRPTTYVDYWHDDFNFDELRHGRSDAPTPIPDGFRLIPGFKNEGVFGDLSAILGGGYVRPRLKGMSGYLPDGIISHHTGDCQDAAMFAYGFEWLREPFLVARIFKNTPFALSSSAPVVPSRWLVYSYSRIVFKGGIDIALSGRKYHAENCWTFWNERVIPTAKYLVEDHASALDSDVLATLQTWINGDTINGPPQGTGLGNTAFFNSDAMVHRVADAGTGDDWYISVRFKTARTLGNEDFESTGKSWHMGSGMLQVKVFGDEYDLVRARMDWHTMPGVTEEWRTDSISKSSEGRCGGSTYGGSVSDGEVGAAAMRYTPHTDDEDNYSVTDADKAWFFGSFGAVALGRGINRAKAGQGNEIVTTLEQARWRGPVTIQVGSSGSSSTLPHDLDGGCSEDRTIPAGETAFLHQGGVGYVIVAPASSNVTLSIRCGNSVTATDSSMAGKSSWGDGAHPENRDRWDPDAGDWYKSDRPFLAVLKHGTDPADAAYQYAVLPAMKVLNAAAKARAFAFFGSEVQVIQNDASAQAVVFPPTGDFRTFQCAFLRANEDVVAPLSSSLTFTVSVDRPAIVQVRTLSDGRFGLAAVDGIADKTARLLNVHLGQDDLLEPGTYPYALPGVEPSTAVDAVDVSRSGGRTLISFGLPNATDDAAYRYQGDLYVGVPMSVKVPKLGGPPNPSPPPMVDWTAGNPTLGQDNSGSNGETPASNPSPPTNEEMFIVLSSGTPLPAPSSLIVLLIVLLTTFVHALFL